MGVSKILVGGNITVAIGTANRSVGFPLTSGPTRLESATYLVLAGVAGRVSGDPVPRHTVYPHCLLLLSFVVFSPSYAPAVDKENNHPPMKYNRPSSKAKYLISSLSGIKLM